MAKAYYWMIISPAFLPPNVVLCLLARRSHEASAATADTTVLPCSFDRAQDKLTWLSTVQVRLGSNPLRCPGGTATFAVSPHRLVKYPGSRKLDYCAQIPGPIKLLTPDLLARIIHESTTATADMAVLPVHGLATQFHE